MSIPIPRGIEVLVKKASVDADFRSLLLARPIEAAAQIGLELSPGEASMLATVHAAQLEAIIARTSVPQEHRRAFLGHAAAAMLAAVGMTAIARAAEVGATKGVRPEKDPPVPVMPVAGIAPAKPPKTIEQRVIEVIDKQFYPVKPPDDPTAKPRNMPTTRRTSLAKDLGATPGGLIKLRQSLEEEFKITLPADEFKKAETVGQVVDQVVQAVTKKTLEKFPERQGPMRGLRIDRPRVPDNP